MDNAFKYVIAEGGLDTEAEYPYKAKQDRSCEAKNSELTAKISAYKDVRPNSVSQLKAAVAQQPVSIAVDAQGFSWQFYFGGVIGSGCGKQLDHGVLAVGYGTHQGKECWKVKNSWGASWGDEGYVWIEMSDANYCGILSQPSYPEA